MFSLTMYELHSLSQVKTVLSKVHPPATSRRKREPPLHEKMLNRFGPSESLDANCLCTMDLGAVTKKRDPV
ncbi:hypothetical protein Cflav_PD4568 [Pedosphaera parvula Ellin514]|uniref:Uncharacterized protein n=1 Tax=Pedosphaera parvula (strain Ellin514) TaxID=320771 RepID=B9XE14_PEDPL|nr:hypothetical protein Cflav_PD4568 [Pedosphaera parvula Ellin514]